MDNKEPVNFDRGAVLLLFSPSPPGGACAGCDTLFMTGTDTPPRMSSSGVTIVKAVIKCAPEGKKEWKMVSESEKFSNFVHANAVLDGIP